MPRTAWTPPNPPRRCSALRRFPFQRADRDSSAAPRRYRSLLRHLLHRQQRRAGHQAHTLCLQPGAARPLRQLRLVAARRARTTPGSSHPTLQRQTAPRQYAHGTSRGRSCRPPEGQRRGDASVSARQTGAQAGAVTLTLDRPRVVIGTLTLQNDLPALQSQTIKLINRLHGDDFDRALTTKPVIASVDDLYRNAGYLDVATSAPTNSAPRKDLNDYAVDLTAAVTPNVLYRVTAITIHAAPPVSEAELQQGR